MELASLILSLVAILISFWATRSSLKYSKIEVFHTMQELMLQKAKDCNFLYKDAIDNNPYARTKYPQYGHIPIIAEMIISIQLLDNSLEKFKQKQERDFFLKQFWTQVDTSLREWVMTVNDAKYPEVAIQQIKDLKRTFTKFYSGKTGKG